MVIFTSDLLNLFITKYCENTHVSKIVWEDTNQWFTVFIWVSTHGPLIGPSAKVGGGL